MKRLRLIFIGVGVAFSFFYLQSVRAQDVGAALEEPTEKTVVLKTEGQGCDINQAESALLRARGVLGVDMEAKPGFLVVTYDTIQTNPQKLADAMDKRMEEKPKRDLTSEKKPEAQNESRPQSQPSQGGVLGNEELLALINNKPEKKPEPVSKPTDKAIDVGGKVSCLVIVVPETPAEGGR